mgnify:FL=1
MISTILRLPDVQWFRSLHYGGNHVCLWWAILPDGGLHIPRELVKGKCLIADLAKEIRTITRDLGLTEQQDAHNHRQCFIRYTVADDKAMTGKSPKGADGETRADTFRNNGIVIRESTHDEAQGWTRVAELLGTRPDGRPMLTIAPECVQLIRALTNAVSDPNDEELLLESANDQPLRALRIGAMSRPSPKPLDPLPLKTHAIGHLVNELRSGSSGNSLEWK